LDLTSLAVKAGLYASALGAAGLGLHAFFLGAEYRRWIVGLALVFAITVASRLLLLNAELAGGFEHILDFSMFDWVWAPNQPQALAYAGGAIVLLAGALLRIRALLLIGAGAMFVGSGLGGHTQGLEAPGINPFLVSAHVAIAAFWVTAPFVLWPSGELPDDALVLRMRKFSQIAVWCVPVLFASGLWLAWRLSGSFEALLSETYGRLLLVKLLLACGALALGGFNKFRVTQHLETDADHGRMILRRTLILDSVLFAGIVLAIAAATTLAGPGG
jgi:putative copper export protein